MDEYREAQVEYFRSKIAEHGLTDRILWNSPRSQATRFRVIAECGIEAGDTVLDVGTGFGGLYAHLQEAGKQPARFLGLDLLAECIEEARRRHPDPQAEFREGTLTGLREEQFDWVVASGIFFLPSEDWSDRTRAWLEEAYSRARRGVAVNFLSSYSAAPDPHSHYTDPGALFSVAMAVTRRVTLRHDYLPHDFTLYLLRDDAHESP
jgi:SAM-dependent methyltransferase